MKNRTLWSVLAATLSIGLAFTTSSQATSLAEIEKSGKIRIAVANEIPYGYIDPSGEAKGAGPDVAKHIMKQLGINDIEWITTDFSGLIPGLQADRFDMVAAEMAILPQRCAKVIYSEPNSSYGEGLLVKTGNPMNIHAYSDFAKNKDLKVAIMAGADQLEMLQALGVDEGQMVTLSSNSDAISSVSSGRSDAYAATSLTAGNLASKSDKVESVSGFKDPVIDGNPVRSWGGFVFAKGSESLRDAVNKELAAYKKTDDWGATLMSYGFSDADLKGSMERTTKELCSE